MPVHRLTRTVAVTLALGAVAAPAATAEPVDRAMPKGFQSADARDAAAHRGIYATATSRQDLRHPDTLDFAEGRGTYNSPDVVVVEAPAPAEPVTTGVDWEDVGVGAGGVLGLALIGAGGALVVTRRRTVRPAA